jgi:hypothetical protein
MEALSTADISQQLSSTFAHLATLQRKAKQLQDDQAQQDVVTFAGTGASDGCYSGVTPHQSLAICVIPNTVEEYGRMIGSVRVRGHRALHRT